MTIRTIVDRVTCLSPLLREEVRQIRLTHAKHGIEQVHEGDWQATVWEGKSWVAAQQIFETIVYIGGKPVPVAGIFKPITKPEKSNHGYGTRAFTAGMAFTCRQFTCNYAMMFYPDKRGELFEDIGWQLVTATVTSQQPSGLYNLSDDFCTLVYCLNETPWPDGSVHLRGLPW